MERSKRKKNENQVCNSISGRGEGDGILVHPRLGQAMALEVKLQRLQYDHKVA